MFFVLRQMSMFNISRSQANVATFACPNSTCPGIPAANLGKCCDMLKTSEFLFFWSSARVVLPFCEQITANYPVWSHRQEHANVFRQNGENHLKMSMYLDSNPEVEASCSDMSPTCRSCHRISRQMSQDVEDTDQPRLQANVATFFYATGVSRPGLSRLSGLGESRTCDILFVIARRVPL